MSGFPQYVSMCMSHSQETAYLAKNHLLSVHLAPVDVRIVSLKHLSVDELFYKDLGNLVNK